MSTPPITAPNQVVARIENLKVHYPIRSGFMNLGPKHTLKAVDGINLTVGKGEILGLVGESGCGKSSLGMAVMRLIKVTDGAIEINGADFLRLEGKALRKARTNIQMIFQDPYASLDPRMTVYECLREPLAAHLKLTGKETEARIRRVMDTVSLPGASLKKYPHEFSGGQRQRVAIARALILEPKLIIADEPVSSLDVSVQAQILNLLKEIRDNLGLSMIFISHNLAVVKYISDRIAVMYLGKIAEIADCEAIYRDARHPYTRALVSAVPIPDPRKERSRSRIDVRGELPSPMNPPKGCPFNTRCPLAFEPCDKSMPALLPIENNASASNASHKVACFAEESQYKGQAPSRPN